ncbi:MAG TPA: hypothetical protein VG652_11975 [Gaiellaceae bacterium]|nr:hypothetical protein [Gaiellaceae bacterium]
MKQLYAAVICGVTVLALCGSASALTVGVNDDAPKDGGVSAWFFSTMQSEGLADDAISVRWDETNPTAIPAQSNIATAIAKANANGVSVELDLYPLHSQALTDAKRCDPSSDPEACGDSANIAAFGTWTASVASAFPSIHQFVVMNECNQPLFINPQWFSNATNSTADKSTVNQSAEVCGRALAAAYDALHAENSSNFVWGIGLSPRGNDQPDASSNSSTKPVTFLHALGAWFTAFAAKTHRTAPLMDGLDDHPYPIPQSQPFAQGYGDPLEASVSNLPRIYQAFYDGFKSSPQKTIGQQSGGGLKVSLNETGIQTAPGSHAAAYSGNEISANSAGGVIPPYDSESYQSSWYTQMLNLVACDPNVAVVNIFHLIDESDLAGWQSGLYFADQQPKQSAGAVANWISTTHGNCTGTPSSFIPTGAVAATTTTTTTTTTTKGATASLTVPAGCTGACAKALKAAATACASTTATKKSCKQALTAAQKQLAVLQKKVKKTKGAAAKTKLNATIKGVKSMLSSYNAKAKKLKK